MSKRKQTDGDEDEQGPDIVDVDFDYHNVDADNDYHAINRLFIQLFGPDAERVQTGRLTDLVTKVAAESGVGSTIKTDEEEGSDPYAILTVISCRDHPGLRGLIDYVVSKTSSEPAFHGALTSLLQEHAKYHVGLVLSERLVNMPVQVMGPMYGLLSEEIEAATDEGYAFTHYLFVSRVYRPAPEEAGARRDSKRHRASDAPQDVRGFHPEEDAILQCATHAVTYGFTDAPPDGVVGLDVAGRAMLVPGEKWKPLVQQIQETCSVVV